MVFFKNMRRRFLQKKFDKSLAVYLQNKRRISKTKINSVAVLTTSEISDNVNIKKKVEEILSVRNVKQYSYLPYQKLHEHSYTHFTENDINWQGKIVDQSFDNFIEQPHDLLISYFNKNNLYLEYATLISKAKFKVGFNNINQNLFDIELAGNTSDIEEFLTELKKYLTILNKI